MKKVNYFCFLMESAPKPIPSFDLIAPVYDALAGLVFGQAQRRAQSHFLSLIPDQARVLVLGGGSGWLLEELLQKTSASYVLYLETSAKMLALAQRRIRHLTPKAQVEFRLGTEQDLLPQERFHVVMTPFVLDLFPPPAVTVMLQLLQAALLNQGLWLHTDFRVSSHRRRQLWQKPLLWAMYRFFGRVSGISAKQLAPLAALFQESGLKCLERKLFYQEFMEASVWQK